MKGVVFTEFLDSAAPSLGPETVDDIVEDADPPHGRACTPLESPAEGMIRAAADHVRQPVAIAGSRVQAPTGACVRFSIQDGV